ALRREFLASRPRAEDLDRQIADAANAASPYVLFCQHKYDMERLDNSSELEACRLRYRDLKLRYNEAVSEFHDRISTLEAQLAAASSFGVIIPPNTARRIADLEFQLARSQSDLQVARDRQSALASELRESTTPHKTAQAEVARLEATIEHKVRRLRTLRDNYERRLRVADTTIATHTAELGRLHDRVSTLDRDLQKASQRAQAAISQRDQARAAHIATQDRVSAARDNIARLEKRINQVERPQNSRQDLESALAKLQQEKDALAVQRDELFGQLGERFMEVTDLRAERDQAQERLSNIASLLPSMLSHKRARSESESPAQSTRVSKAARSTSGPFPAGALSHASASRPRSSFCRPWLPAGRLKDASSSFAASEASAPRDGGESSSGESGSTHVFDSDAAGSDSGSPDSSRAKNEFGMPSGPLSDAELVALPPTT
ncbi:hypothetical protein L915_12370, partial [Phytophthora nicotianae]